MFSLLAALALAPGPKIDLPSLDARLHAICARFQGRMGFHLTRLDTGEEIGDRDDERFPTASTIKTAIAVHAVREVDAGRLKWDTPHPLPDAKDRVEYDVSEWSYYMKDGTTLDLDGYVTLMLTVSDNLATRVLRLWLGTANIDRTLTQLGFKDTLVLSNAPPEETRLRRLNGQFGMGMTTPREMARLFAMIYRRQAASPAGCERLMRTLSHPYWDDLIAQTVPPGVFLMSKSGAIDRSRSEAALVVGNRPYVLTVYIDAMKDRHWASDNAGEVAIRRIGTEVWKALSPENPYTPPVGWQKYVPNGGGV